MASFVDDAVVCKSRETLITGVALLSAAQGRLTLEVRRAMLQFLFKGRPAARIGIIVPKICKIKLLEHCQ